MQGLHPKLILVGERGKDPFVSSKVALLGVEFNQSLYLLTLAANPAWKINEARQAAGRLLERIEGDSILFCAGARVARAIKNNLVDRKYPLLPGVIVTDRTKSGKLIRYTRIPSMSFSNKQWHNREFIGEVAERIRINLKEEMYV